MWHVEEHFWFATSIATLHYWPLKIVIYESHFQYHIWAQQKVFRSNRSLLLQWFKLLWPLGGLNQIDCIINVIIGGSTRESLSTNNFWKWCTTIISWLQLPCREYFYWFNYTICFKWLLLINCKFFDIVLILEQWGWGVRFWDSTSQFVYLHPVPFPPKIRTLGKCSTYKRALYLTSTSSAILNFTQKPISYQNGSLCQFLC